MVSLLEARALSFGHPGRLVGEGVSLRVEPGEVVAILGPNGGGKTTLLRTLGGSLRPVSGEVLVAGEPLGRWPRRRLAGFLGYVPQAHAGVFAWTAEEIVLMGRTAHLPRFGVPSRRDHEVARAALDGLGVGALAPRVYSELSGGERQLVLLARALAQEPRALLMDEPTSSLDFGNQIRVLDHVAALAGRGIAVLMTTHHPDHALRVAHRVALLKAGRLVADGNPRALLAPEALARLYDVDPSRLGAGRAALSGGPA